MGSENHKNLLKKLGKRIVELRQQMQLDQNQLAFEANIGLRTLRRIEKGDHNPQAETLISLAQALEVHPAALWNFEVEKDFFFSEIQAKRCPFEHHEQCCFLPNQNRQ